MNIEKKIKRVDKEDRGWFNEIKKNVFEGNVKKEELFHFKPPTGSKAYLISLDDLNNHISLKSLLPLYDTIYYYVGSFDTPFSSSDKFKNYFKSMSEEIIKLSEKKRVIPIFNCPLSIYPKYLVEPLIEYNLPYVSVYEEDAVNISYLKKKNMLNTVFIKEKNIFNYLLGTFNRDTWFDHLKSLEYTESDYDCLLNNLMFNLSCLNHPSITNILPLYLLLYEFIISILGILAKSMNAQAKELKHLLSMRGQYDECLNKHRETLKIVNRNLEISNFLALMCSSLARHSSMLVKSSSIDSVLQYPEKGQEIYDLLSRFGLYGSMSILYEKNLVTMPSKETYNLDYVVKNLRIAYSDEIPLEDYIAIFGSNTTEKMRRVVEKIINDSKSKESPHHELRRIIDDYNTEIEEFSTRKRTKILYGISNVINKNKDAIKSTLVGPIDKYVGTGLDKFSLPDKEKQEISKWFGEKTESLQAAMLGISPDVLQLHKVREELKMEDKT